MAPVRVLPPQTKQDREKPTKQQATKQTNTQPKNRGEEETAKRGSDMEAPDKNTKQILQARQWTLEDKAVRGVSKTSVPRQQHQMGEHPGTHNANGTTKKKPRGRMTGRAAGAGRRHQHRDNPTQRTGGGEARRQQKTGGERHTRTSGGTYVLY